MSKESEDYLDQLLSSVQAQQPRQEKQNREKPVEVSEKPRNRRQSRSQEDFLREFEQELSGLDEDQLISDFELSLEPEVFAEKEEPGEVDRDTEFDLGDEIQNSEEPETPVKEPKAEEPESEDSFFAGLDAAMNVEEESSGSEEQTGQGMFTEPGNEEHENAPGDGVGGLSMDDFPDLFADAEPEPQGVQEMAGESGNIGISEGSSQTDADEAGADDILALLDGLGEENEDLADIGSMLRADENNEAIGTEEEITAESVAESLADLGFEISPEDADELAKFREVPAKRTVDITEEESRKSKEKKGFLTKMMNLFFGPDEEETAAKQEASMQENLSGVSDENLDILKALEGGASSPEEDAKAKKKAKKEEKKKAAAAKKEAKSKNKEAKKKAKSAAKAAKPKKEKKPKVKDNTPPLPKKPVFLIFLLAASILGSVLFAGKGMYRRLAMSDSKDYYTQGEYVKAYREVAGLEIKDDNEEELRYVEKIEMMAGVQQLYESYQIMEDAGRKELALDCLIRIVGHYDANIEKAGELGCSAELTEYEGLAEELLTSKYKTSFDKVLQIYQIRSRTRYSTELVRILKEAGIE